MIFTAKPLRYDRNSRAASFYDWLCNDPEVRCFLAKSGVKCLGKPFPVKKLIECVRELLAAPTTSA